MVQPMLEQGRKDLDRGNSNSRKRPFTLSAKNRMAVYERVWLGLPVKGGWGYWGTGQTGNER